LSYHIKYTISPDGRQTAIKIEGIKGPACHDVTKQLESKFGKCTQRKDTAEFGEQAEGQIETQIG